MTLRAITEVDQHLASWYERGYAFSFQEQRGDKVTIRVHRWRPDRWHEITWLVDKEGNFVRLYSSQNSSLPNNGFCERCNQKRADRTVMDMEVGEAMIVCQSCIKPKDDTRIGIYEWGWSDLFGVPGVVGDPNANRG